jgi:hypothetical protein
MSGITGTTNASSASHCQLMHASQSSGKNDKSIIVYIVLQVVLHSFHTLHSPETLPPIYSYALIIIAYVACISMSYLDHIANIADVNTEIL